MYGSDGRGGGRGSRGGHRGRSFRGKDRGRGAGGQRRGPALPFSLLRELGDDRNVGVADRGGYKPRGGAGAHVGFGGRGRDRGDLGGGSRQYGNKLATGGSGGGGDGISDSKKRSAERAEHSKSDHKRQRKDRQPAERRETLTDGSRGGGTDLRVGGVTRTLAATKRRQQPGVGSGSRGTGTSSKTKFHELLVDGWENRNSREAFLEELRLQARLAKKLGKSKKDTLDGMDKLMGTLSAGSGSLLPQYLDSVSRQEAEELLEKVGSGSGPGDLDPTVEIKAMRPKGPTVKQSPSNAAAVVRQVAEMLDRESDEELEFFGIDPGSNRADGDEDEDGKGEDGRRRRRMYGFNSGSGSEDGGDGLEDGEMYDSDNDDDDDDEMANDEDEDEAMEGESDDEYDMFDHLMGSDSEEGEEDQVDGEEDPRGFSPKSKSGSEAKPKFQSAGRVMSCGEDDEGDDDEEEQEDHRGPDPGFPQGKAKAIAAKGGVETAVASAGGSSAGGGGRAAQQKYLPPALRAHLAAGAAGGAAEDAARLQVERRVTGLINRLAEVNLQSISRDVAELYGSQGRRLVSEAVATQILGAAESGPRASEQFAAVAAAFMTAVAAQADAQDIAAGFLAELAQRLEAARNNGDSLAQANLVTLLAYCYSAGLVGPGLCYSLLRALKERFQEADVAAMVTLLNAVGLQLRNSDPGLMKEFVLGVHERAAQLGRDGQISRRAQLMLELVIDIKNNKTSVAGGAAAAAAAATPNVSLGGTATRKGKATAAAATAAAGGSGGGGRRGGALAVLQPSVAKWLQQLGVEEVCLRGLTWQKLLAPNKKGMWWMPVAGEALDDPLMLAAAGASGAATDGGNAAAAAAVAAAAASNAKLLELAAAQRMNTDARRAVFVAIMSSEDCVEAHEKLLRLPLKGDQRREIVRVLVDCCLGEKTWNPYYAYLALRLCGGGTGPGGGGGGSLGRAHRVTMQYCLWDKVKELESMDVRQLTHLAKLAALLVAQFALSLSILKVVDWSDLSAKELLTWRIFLQQLLSSCKTAGDVKEVFARVACQPKSLSDLISGLLLFLRTSFAPWAATKLPPGADSDELLRRTRVAEKELVTGAATAAAVLI